jgi:hypothetical protein
MSSLQQELVSAIIHEGTLNEARKAGITTKMLILDPMAAAVYEEIQKYAKDPLHSGRVPSEVWVRKRFRQFDLTPPTRCMGEIIHEVFNDYMTKRMGQVILDTRKIWEKDPRVGARVLISSALALQKETTRGQDTVMELSLADTVLKEYQQIKTGQGKTGIPWPKTWTPLHNNTLGQCEGDYYVVYGLTKTMKTWLVEYILVEDYLNTDSRILMYIQEMKKDITLRRLALLLARVSSERYIRGQLLSEEETRLRQAIERLESDAKTDPKNSRLLLMGGGETAGVDTLRSRVKDWGARLVFADSAYLMSDDRTKSRGSGWQNVANISTDLRNLALEENCSVFTTSQESERVGRQMGRHGTASIAYAHKLVEDAEIAFHVYRFDDDTTGESELGLEFPATRESRIPPFTIHACPADNFTFKKMGLRREKNTGDMMSHLGVANSSPVPGIQRCMTGSSFGFQRTEPPKKEADA